MPQRIRLWEIAEGSDLIEIRSARLDFESRLEDWLEKDISLLDLDLLVIGRQVPTDFGGSIDLLALDRAGDTVIVELKRDRTPRDTTAQALDYASWVADLSNERVTELANEYLGNSGPLEHAFRSAFDEDLPEILNESHQVVVVASGFDSSSERIIRYLSDTYGVNINAVTFQYFRSAEGRELLGRVFLLEPASVEYRARTKRSAKRKPNLTCEQLKEIAEERGIGTLFREVVRVFKQLFPDTPETTQSSISFVGRWKEQRSTILNLIPGESDESRGLRFQLYTFKASDIFGKTVDEIVSLLPPSSEEWEYYSNAPQERRGHVGFFQTVREAEDLAKGLSNEGAGS